MGYNTALMILNDRLHEIKDDPDFGKKIYDAVVMSRVDKNRQPYLPQVTILPSEHADVAQVVLITANSMQTLGFGYWKDSKEDLLRKLACEAGFRLVKKTQRNRKPSE